jgi:hypothetical protein
VKEFTEYTEKSICGITQIWLYYGSMWQQFKIAPQYFMEALHTEFQQTESMKRFMGYIERYIPAFIFEQYDRKSRLPDI